MVCYKPGTFTSFVQTRRKKIKYLKGTVGAISSDPPIKEITFEPLCE